MLPAKTDDLFTVVLSAVSGVELAMEKEHHKCKIFFNLLHF